MACCLIAAYLMSRAIDYVARLAVFWGLRRTPPGRRMETAASRLRGALQRRRVAASQP